MFELSCVPCSIPNRLWVPVGAGACCSLMADYASLNVFWVIPREVSWERAAPHVSSCSALRDSLLSAEFGISSYYSHGVFRINAEFVSLRGSDQNLICASGFRAVCQSKICSPSSGRSTHIPSHLCPLLIFLIIDGFADPHFPIAKSGFIFQKGI